MTAFENAVARDWAIAALGLSLGLFRLAVGYAADVWLERHPVAAARARSWLRRAFHRR